MDIVIPLGNGSIWKNNELRYCLRSIQKHCKDFRNIVLIGEKPDWIHNVIHIPYVETAKHDLNIWHKTVFACKQEQISDNFLFCNDDFFFLKPFSTDYPNIHMGTLSDYLLKTRPIPYYFKVERTYQLLLKNNLPTIHYDIHRPIVFNKAEFLEMAAFFHPEGELIMKSCYGNYWKLEAEQADDVKVSAKYKDQLEKHLRGADMFSIYDSLCGMELYNYLERWFSRKSKFES